MPHDATANLEHPGQASGPGHSVVSVAHAEVLQQVAVLQVARQADGTITTAVHVADELDLHPSAGSAVPLAQSLAMCTC